MFEIRCLESRWSCSGDFLLKKTWETGGAAAGHLLLVSISIKRYAYVLPMGNGGNYIDCCGF